MKASTSSAEDTPCRAKNSWKGSTTASRRVRGAASVTAGSRTISVMTMPGSMNSEVIMNTMSHGMRSARISDSDPGTRPEMR